MFSRLSMLFLGLLAGCTSIVVYKNPLTELSESTTRTRVAIEDISSEANRAKVRTRAIEAATASKRFGTDDLSDLVPEEFIQVRADSLRLIERLATRLLAVVDSKKGAEVAASVENVGKKTATLAENLGNTKLAQYAGPVSSLAGTVIKIYDQKKREEILLLGVNEGIPQAQNVIVLLKADFDPASATNVSIALRQELEEQVSERINQYDLILKSEKKLTDAQKKEQQRIADRMEAIEKIIIAQEAVNALNSQLVNQTLDDLSQALEKLQKVVNSNQDPKEFSIFVAQLTEFSARSVQLLNAVQAVKEAGSAKEQ